MTKARNSNIIHPCGNTSGNNDKSSCKRCHRMLRTIALQTSTTRDIYATNNMFFDPVVVSGLSGAIMTSAETLMSTKMWNKAFDTADRKSAKDAGNNMSRASLPTRRERWSKKRRSKNRGKLTARFSMYCKVTCVREIPERFLFPACYGL